MSEVKNLVFDLDGTLYPLSSGLAQECERRVHEFLRQRLSLSDVEAAKLKEDLQQHYYYEARAMQSKFGVSEKEFLEYVCATTASILDPNPDLQLKLAALPQRKFIYTDSTLSHTREVFKQLGVKEALFETIYDAEKGGFIYKLTTQAVENFCRDCQINPQETMLFEDSCRILNLAKPLGFITVLIAEDGGECGAADYVFPDINTALQQLFS